MRIPEHLGLRGRDDRISKEIQRVALSRARYDQQKGSGSKMAPQEYEIFEDTAIDISPIKNALRIRENKESRRKAKDEFIGKMQSVLDSRGTSFVSGIINGENADGEPVKIEVHDKITKPVPTDDPEYPFVYIKSDSTRSRVSYGTRQRIHMYVTENSENPTIDDSNQIFVVGLAGTEERDESFATAWDERKAGEEEYALATQLLNRIENALPEVSPSPTPQQ